MIEYTIAFITIPEAYFLRSIHALPECPNGKKKLYVFVTYARKELE